MIDFPPLPLPLPLWVSQYSGSSVYERAFVCGGAQVARWGWVGGGLHHPGALAAPQEAREGNPIFFRCPPHQGPVGWHLRCRAWGVSPLAAASFFLDAQKEAKEAPGGATGRTSALRPRSPCCLPPGPPFYGGRQLGSSCGFPKGAGGVGIDAASPTAAAAWVGFPA